jgi:tetratricopeptide (TPR) repeat protein
MWARCQRAATQLGDLASALKFAGLIVDLPHVAVTQRQQEERDKLAEGANWLQKLERAQTTQDERLATYNALMARFPTVQHFLCKYCEQCMAADKFGLVVAKLANQSVKQTPETAFLLGKALYMCGFEEFQRAEAALAEFASASDECRALQQTIVKIADLRERGNSSFQNRMYGDAVAAYSAGIQLASSNGRVLSVLRCNRAAAHKELGRFREAIEDCTAAIVLNPGYCKAFARRAQCLLGCRFFQSAVADFRQACVLSANDSSILAELRNAERVAADELAKEKDLYSVLGVARTATTTEITSCFRKLCLQFHPDKLASCPDAMRAEGERKFKLINDAHQTLSDDESRRMYDEKLVHSWM